MGLPSPVVEACSYAPQQNSIRTQMDAGAAKMRRRFTRVPEDVTFSLMLTRPQVFILTDFIEATLKDVLPFDWIEFRHPGKSPATYRFKSRPKMTPVTPTLWRVELELELLSAARPRFPIANESRLLIDTGDGAALTT